METNRYVKSDTSSLRAHIGFWLRLVSNNVSLSFSKKLTQMDVSVAEWVVLREIYDSGTIAPSHVAELTGLSRGAVSKLIEKLLQKGYINRDGDATDRRFQKITLTDTGKKIVPILASIADENDEEFFTSLNHEEKQAFVSMLQKIAKNKNLNTAPIE